MTLVCTLTTQTQRATGRIPERTVPKRAPARTRRQRTDGDGSRGPARGKRSSASEQQALHGAADVLIAEPDVLDVVRSHARAGVST
ncbi:hypothetical protein ABZ208_23870, partial [Streptomyces sp. NPDC006208]|uniref:hypothetical protein n=1 Tax=Streptomyces sp. NPDC006208 TaxID=3156734 RepID=UPI0033ADCB92